jgi:hypothetical protein
MDVNKQNRSSQNRRPSPRKPLTKDQVKRRQERQNCCYHARKAAEGVQAELLPPSDENIPLEALEMLIDPDSNSESVSAPALKCRKKVRRGSTQATDCQKEKAESFSQVAKKCSRQCAKMMQASDLLEAIDGVTQDKLNKALVECKSRDDISAILGPDVLPYFVGKRKRE